MAPSTPSSVRTILLRSILDPPGSIRCLLAHRGGLRQFLGKDRPRCQADLAQASRAFGPYFPAGMGTALANNVSPHSWSGLPKSDSVWIAFPFRAVGLIGEMADVVVASLLPMGDRQRLAVVLASEIRLDLGHAARGASVT